MSRYQSWPGAADAIAGLSRRDEGGSRGVTLVIYRAGLGVANGTARGESEQSRPEDAMKLVGLGLPGPASFGRVFHKISRTMGWTSA